MTFEHPGFQGYSLDVTINYLPPLPNQMLRKHYLRIKRMNDKTRAQMFPLIMQGRPDAPLETAKITLIRGSSREPDFDGLVGSFKAVLDGLVKAGIIKDDKVSVIGQPTYLWERTSPKKGYIRIQISSKNDKNCHSHG